MLNKQKVKGFRGDFEKAVAQLEKDYGVTISLGTIRFDSQELRAKMTAKVGDAPVKASKDEFNVGDVVGINHKKVNPKDQFRIYKINSKNIGVEKIAGEGRIGAQMRVSPSLLFKK
tara:strand:- start:1589 stop:1936 length:348 start_codon:yes stop_codon:yes gene_type:complete